MTRIVKIVSIVFVAFSSLTLNAQDLVFHYPFNDNLNDSSANNFELVPFNTNYVFDTGKHGSSLKLDGTKQFFDIMEEGLSDPSANDVSVCAWIYNEYEQGTDFKEQLILVQKNGSTDNPKLGRNHMFVSRDGRNSVGSWLGSELHLGGETSVEVGKWHHLAMVATTSNKTVTFYVDGVLDAVVVSSKAFEKCTGGFRIGGHKNGNFGFWHGLLDEVYVFKGALTEEQVNTVMNNQWTDRTHQVVTTQSLENTIDIVETFIAAANTGSNPGEYPIAAFNAVNDTIVAAKAVVNDINTTMPCVDSVEKHLLEAWIDMRWQRVPVTYEYTGNLVDVLGDIKQVLIRDLLESEEQIQLLLLAYRDLGVNGIRIPIFGRDSATNELLNPAPELMKQLYEEGLDRGFKFFANPAEWAGGKRIAHGIAGQTSDGPGGSVRDMPEKTQTLIERMIEFGNEYDQLTWISPFNEDGNTKSSGVWSPSQVNTIYGTLDTALPAGMKLIGPDTWGIPQGIAVVEESNIEDYISIFTVHNLGKQPALWPNAIQLGNNLGLPVWDSEANFGADEGEDTRIHSAIKAGVDGIVLYNLWTDALTAHPYYQYKGTTAKWMNEYLENVISVHGNTAMNVNDNQTVTATYNPIDIEAAHFTWQSSAPGVASVTEQGVVTALSEGTAYIYTSLTSGPRSISDSLEITVTGTTSIDNAQELASLDVYPNPVQNYLSIELPNTGLHTYQVLSLSGVLLITGKVTGSAQIDVSNLKSGMYMVNLIQQETTNTIRIIKR